MVAKKLRLLSLLGLLTYGCSNDSPVATGNRSEYNSAVFHPTSKEIQVRSSAADGSVGLTDSGLLDSQLVVDLAEAQVFGRTPVPVPCFGVLPADFVIGRAVCAKDAARSVPLVAANARQICSSSPSTFGAPVEASQAVQAIPGCSSVNIDVKVYDPPLTVTVGKTT